MHNTYSERTGARVRPGVGRAHCPRDTQEYYTRQIVFMWDINSYFTYSVLALTFEKTISTSVAVIFLSSSFISRKSFANFDPSMSGAVPLVAPKAQNDLNTSGSDMAESGKKTIGMVAGYYYKCDARPLNTFSLYQIAVTVYSLHMSPTPSFFITSHSMEYPIFILLLCYYNVTLLLWFAPIYTVGQKAVWRFFSNLVISDKSVWILQSAKPT